MPKVSVIVPVYNVANYIERCAICLFEQTLDDIEFLFIDDCSPDRSIDILQQVLDKYPQRKPQVTIHRMEKNSGQAAVRKWGMQNANGEYLIHCDSDDWVDADMYRYMYSKAKEEDADVVVCDFVVNDGQSVLKTVKGCHSTNSSDFIKNLLFQKDPWSLWNKLFRKTVCYREIIYPENNLGEDMALTIQLMQECKIIQYIEQPFYNYFYNPNSITHVSSLDDYLRNFESLKANVEIVENVIRPLYKSKEIEYALVSLKLSVLVQLFNFSNVKVINNLLRNTYSDLSYNVFRNPYVKFSLKVKYLLSFLGIYPYLKKVIGK